MRAVRGGKLLELESGFAEPALDFGNDRFFGIFSVRFERH